MYPVHHAIYIVTISIVCSLVEHTHPTHHQHREAGGTDLAHFNDLLLTYLVEYVRFCHYLVSSS